MWKKLITKTALSHIEGTFLTTHTETLAGSEIRTIEFPETAFLLLQSSKEKENHLSDVTFWAKRCQLR